MFVKTIGNRALGTYALGVVQTPPPSSYSQVDAACIYCRQTVRMQIIAATFRIRCPRCGRTWEDLNQWAEVCRAGRVADEVLDRQVAVMRNSIRASGGQPSPA